MLLISVFKGACAKVSSINDKREWNTVQKALSVIDFSKKEIEVAYKLKQSFIHHY